MSKSQKKGRCPRKVLRIPDLEQSKNAVLNSLPAKASQESYGHAIDEFMGPPRNLWANLPTAEGR